MSDLTTIIAILVLAAIAGWAFYKDKQYAPGHVPLIPYIYIQFTALIILLALVGHLFSSLTGITWSPPRRG